MGSAGIKRNPNWPNQPRVPQGSPQGGQWGPYGGAWTVSGSSRGSWSQPSPGAAGGARPGEPPEGYDEGAVTNTAARIGDMIVDFKKQWFQVIQGDGKGGKIFRGDAQKTSLSGDLSTLAKGRAVVHNHTEGGSFGADDWVTGAALGVRKMFVASKDTGRLYEINFGDKFARMSYSERKAAARSLGEDWMRRFKQAAARREELGNKVKIESGFRTGLSTQRKQLIGILDHVNESIARDHGFDWRVVKLSVWDSKVSRVR